MSILIKGTKMPKNCGECQSTLGLFASECPLFAEFPKKFDYDPEIGNNRRYDGCPLVEIPPHGRLIDADKMMRDNLFTERDRGFIFDAPTVIESEVEDECSG